MGSDGTVTAPDGSGRQVKLITADDVVAYLKAHPDFFEKHQARRSPWHSSSTPTLRPSWTSSPQCCKRLRRQCEHLKTSTPRS